MDDAIDAAHRAFDIAVFADIAAPKSEGFAETATKVCGRPRCKRIENNDLVDPAIVEQQRHERTPDIAAAARDEDA